MEEWKDIEWYEWLYQVSNLGRIKSFKNSRWWVWKYKIIYWWKNKKWYTSIIVGYNWNSKINKTVHRLVAKHFIPNPLNLPYVCHKDETLDENWRLYNWSDNLFWWTAKDNVKDMWEKWRGKSDFIFNHPRSQLWKFWKDNKCSKSVMQFSLNWEFIKEWDCMSDIFRTLWINISNISNVCNWRLKYTGWFIWRFK